MHKNDLKYLKRVTGALRWRHVDDEQVVLVLRDLRRDIKRTGIAAQDQFGDVTDYVKGVPKGSAWHRGQIFGIVSAVLLLIGWVAAAWILRGDPLPLRTAAMLTVPVLVGCVVLLGIGRVVDSRLPRNWRGE